MLSRSVLTGVTFGEFSPLDTICKVTHLSIKVRQLRIHNRLKAESVWRNWSGIFIVNLGSGDQSLVLGGQSFGSTRTLLESDCLASRFGSTRTTRGADSLVELSHRTEQKKWARTRWSLWLRSWVMTGETSRKASVAAPLRHLDLVADWRHRQRPPRRQKKKHTVAGLEFAKEQLKDSQTVSKPRRSSGLSSDRLEEAKHLSSPTNEVSRQYGWLIWLWYIIPMIPSYCIPWYIS